MKRSTRTMIFGFVILAVIMPVFAYNLDGNFPSVFSYQKRFNDYMGYSVLLHADPNSNKSWLLIGSPKSNQGPKGEEFGAVHRCPLHDDSSCTIIQPNIISDEDGFIAQVKSKAHIRKDHGWLGSSMSVQRSTGILTVCAPRTLVSIFDSVEHTELETMHGVCYTSLISSEVLYIEDKHFATYDFAKRFWYNPLHGFSIHYARTRSTVNNKTNEVNRIIGEPAHDIYGTVEVKHSSTARISVDLSTTDELSMFGYSVTAGYFFKEDQLLYAAGAPGWQYVGQVGIIDPVGNGTIVTKLRGTDVGEFFGGSLAAGDVNNDGLDDLIVGAPHFGNDNGKIYVFVGTPNEGTFDIAISVPGTAEGGYFGYTLACGDLDADGFADIIVGAPWEDQGVVYVFNGGSDIKEKGSLEASQRISPTELSLINPLLRIQTFAFSLSEPVDIDGNGYPDIAVGAYKSEHAIILYSKPVVKTQLAMQFVPRILGRNVREFIVKVCAVYHNYSMRSAQDFKITLTLDEQHRRTKELQLVLQSSEFTDSCLYSNVTVLERVDDFIEPIIVLAKHEFLDPKRIAFCKTCPVESRHSTMNIVQGSLPFDIGCGVDNVCTANISVTLTFYGVQDKNNTWIIGSNDISLCIILENHGEPAYLTTIMLALPEKIILRSILTSCQEDESGGSPVIICDAGNPLGQGEKKAINIDLDMRHLNNGSLHGNKLSFTIGVNTRSVNQGTTKIEKVLNLVSEVSLSLNGKANEESYYLSLIDDGVANVSFQHVYQIFKLGMTPIEAARLIVRVPTSAMGWDSLISVHKPQLILSGKAYQCTTSDIVLLEAEGNDAGGKSVADVSTLTSIHRMQNTTLIPNEIVRKKLRKSQDPKQYLSVMLEEMQSLYRANDFGIRDARIDALYSSEILYFNCSTPNVNCSSIVCDLTAFRTLLDVGTVHMTFTLDTSKLNDVLMEDTEILKFSVDVYTEILQPQRCAAIVEARSRMDVATIFYIPRAAKVQLWIILLSVSVGLLFLLIIATVLSRTGFFKRSQKEKLSALKNTEVSEMDNKETGDNSQVEDT